MGVVLASLVAAGAGGALGIVGAKAVSGQGASVPASLGQDIAAMKQNQSEAATQLAELVRDQSELEIRLRDEMTKLAAGSDSSASLGPLIAELDKVSKRLDDAVASGGNGSALAALQARVDALESVEPGGEVTSDQVQRVIAALTARADQLEASLNAIRDAAPKDQERMTRIENGLAALQSGLSSSASANSEDSQKLTGLIEQMRADEAAARVRAEAATRNAEAALAMVAIETAAGQGRSFDAEYRKLRTLMPRVEDVRRLGTFAGEAPPTVMELRTSFAPAADVAREAIPTMDKGALGWLTTVFGDAVRVREGGDGASVNEALDAATEALARGDLVVATETVSALTGAPASALSDWTKAANRRINLDAALKDARIAVTLGETDAP